MAKHSLTVVGLDVIASNKAEENRATCLLGQKALRLSEEVNLASGNSWQLLRSKISNYARTKSVAGF
jgi:hypothetical protein